MRRQAKHLQQVDPFQPWNSSAVEKEALSSAGARLVALEKGITCCCVFVADCTLDNVQSLYQIC